MWRTSTVHFARRIGRDVVAWQYGRDTPAKRAVAVPVVQPECRLGVCFFFRVCCSFKFRPQRKECFSQFVFADGAVLCSLLVCTLCWD